MKREKYLVHFSKFSSKMINLNSGIKELAGENLTFSNDILEIWMTKDFPENIRVINTE